MPPKGSKLVKAHYRMPPAVKLAQPLKHSGASQTVVTTVVKKTVTVSSTVSKKYRCNVWNECMFLTAVIAVSVMSWHSQHHDHSS